MTVIDKHMKNFISVLFRIVAGAGLLVLFNAHLCMGNDLKRIFLLETMSVKVVIERSHWFRVQMKELGYREGINMTLKVLKANGSYERAESLLNSALAENKPDLVETNGTLASKAAAKILGDSNIPQLFLTVSDPVGAGLVLCLSSRGRKLF
jgi:putative ABC transport system substrate-binding protein